MKPAADADRRVSGRNAGLVFSIFVFAAAFLPLLVLVMSGWSQWQSAHSDADNDLSRSADAAAEYAERVLGADVLAAQLVNQILDGYSDEEIRAREAELHALLKNFLPTVPMANTIAVSDRNGIVLLTANIMPVPQVSVADREWVQALRKPDFPQVHVSTVTTGRIDNNFFFGISIRRTRETDREASAFHGVINVSVNPDRLGTGFEAITRDAGDVMSLVRMDGETLARNPSFSRRLPSLPAESLLRQAMARQEPRGLYDAKALGLEPFRAAGEPLRVSYRKVGGLPVYVAVSRSKSAIRERWEARMLALSGVTIPASLLLVVMALMIRRNHRGIREREAEFRAAFESPAVGNALVDVETGLIERVNRRFCEITGYQPDDLIARIPLRDILRAEERSGSVPGGRVPAAMKLTEMKGTYRLLRADGVVRWIEVSVAEIRGPRDGRQCIAAIQDATARKAAEERQTLLAREVDHRAKNVLAVVQSVVRLSRSGDPDHYARIVEGRVLALARAHEALARDQWNGADLGELVRQEVAFLPRERVALDGERLRVMPHAVQPVSMALHELATNAARYGALSNQEGRIVVSWRRTGPRGPLHLRWAECGGPAIAESPPPGKIGLTIIGGSIAQTGGQAQMAWNPEGLCVEIILPSSQISEVAAAPQPAPTTPPAPRIRIEGFRILLVEDEALVAMDTARLLRELGCDVLGPVGNLEEALQMAQAEIKSGRVHAAVLDVNLGGRNSFTLADYLIASDVPVVFATGYDELPPSETARASVVLKKPVSSEALRRALESLTARGVQTA